MSISNFFVDAGEVLANIPYTSPQGHLRVDANVTRVGVLRYFLTDGSYRDVLRHPDEVFHPRSLESLAGVPITLSHPIEDGKNVAVTPQNYKKFGKGVVGDRIKIANPYVRIEGLNIQTDDALSALKFGNKQLSPGYFATPVPESGVWDGIPYTHRQYGVEVDGIGAGSTVSWNYAGGKGTGKVVKTYREKITLTLQGAEVTRNGSADDPALLIEQEDGAQVLKLASEVTATTDSYILYNHLAIMQPGEIGRSGAEVKVLNFDGADAWLQVDYDFSDVKPKVIDLGRVKPKMTRFITLHGDSSTSYQVDEAGTVTVPVEKLTMMMDLLSELMSLKTEAAAASEMTGLDSVKAIADAYQTLKGEKAIVDSELAKRIDPAEISKLVAKRVELERVARPILGDGFKADASDVELMKAAIAKYNPELQTDGIEEPELRGMFRAVSKVMSAANSNVDEQAKIIKDAEDKPVVTDAATRMNNIRDRMRNKGKKAVA